MGKIAILCHSGHSSEVYNYVVEASNILLKVVDFDPIIGDTHKILRIEDKSTNQILWHGFNGEVRIINSKGNEILFSTKSVSFMGLMKYIVNQTNVIDSPYVLSGEIYKVILQDM